MAINLGSQTALPDVKPSTYNATPRQIARAAELNRQAARKRDEAQRFFADAEGFKRQNKLKRARGAYTRAIKLQEAADALVRRAVLVLGGDAFSSQVLPSEQADFQALSLQGDGGGLYASLGDELGMQTVQTTVSQPFVVDVDYSTIAEKAIEEAEQQGVLGRIGVALGVSPVAVGAAALGLAALILYLLLRR